MGNSMYICIFSLFLHSINFNQDSSLLCVSSDHGTVHVFASEDPGRNKQSRYAYSFHYVVILNLV